MVRKSEKSGKSESRRSAISAEVPKGKLTKSGRRRKFKSGPQYMLIIN